MRGRCKVGWTFREECEGGGQEAGAGPDGSDSGACILCTHLSGPSQEGMGAPGPFCKEHTAALLSRC